MGGVGRVQGQRTAEEDGQHQGGGRQLQRVGQRVGQRRGHRPPGRHRVAEVAAQRPAQVAEVLDKDRLVEAVLPAQRLELRRVDGGLVEPAGGHRRDRIAGQEVEYQEGDRVGRPQHHHRLPEATG